MAVICHHWYCQCDSVLYGVDTNMEVTKRVAALAKRHKSFDSQDGRRVDILGDLVFVGNPGHQLLDAQ